MKNLIFVLMLSLTTKSVMAKTLVGHCSAFVDDKLTKVELEMAEHPNNRFGIVAQAMVGPVEVLLKLNFMTELQDLGKYKTDTATLSYLKNTRHDISMRLLANGVPDNSTLSIEGKDAVDVTCEIAIR